MATFIQGVTDILPEQSLYKPDFAFIDKMMQRKAAMYEQGFQQLNNQYNLINRELTNPMNVKNRDQFLIAAKNNLKDLSSMDLSDMANVKAATSVFKPFWENSLILEDQAITEFWKQQENIANGYRNKDGGKDFSEKNLRYVQLQKMEFAKDDPSNVGKYSANRRYYTPYTDWKKHWEEAIKNFKPSEGKWEYVNGMYKFHEEDASWTVEELSSFLKGALSDKDKEQMRIEAAVDFYGQTDALAKALQATNELKIPTLTTLIDKIDSRIKIEKDPTKLAELKQNREYYDTERARRSDELKKIQSGDIQFIKDNQENLAFQFYFDNVVEDYARSKAHTVHTKTFTGDDVQMMYYRQGWDNYWKQKEFDWKNTLLNYDWMKFTIKMKQTAAGSLGTPIASANPIASDVDFSFSGMEQKIADNEDLRNAAMTDIITTFLKSTDAKALGLDPSSVNSNDPNVLQKLDVGVQAFIKKYPDNDFVKTFNQYSNEISNITSMMEADANNAMEKLEYGMGSENYINYRRLMEGKTTDLLGKPMSLSYQAKITGMATQIWNKHTDESTTKRKQSYLGMTFPVSSGIYKETQTYLQNLFSESQMRGITFAPEPYSLNGQMNLVLGITDDKLIAALRDESNATTFEGQTRLDLLEKYSNRLTPGVPVEFDSKTNQLIIKGNFGSTVANGVDPFKTIPELHRTQLGYVSSVPLNPGESSGKVGLNPSITVDKKGKSRNVQIQDYMPKSGGSRKTNLFIDNQMINQVFGSAAEAEAFSNFLLQQNDFDISDLLLNE